MVVGKVVVPHILICKLRETDRQTDRGPGMSF